MFTIKHIGGSLEHFETVGSGNRVVFYSNAEEVGLYPGKNISLSEKVTVFDDKGKIIQTFTGGTVYVMNNHGSTVAKYDMSDLE
jgi:hypothetical protein